MLGGMIFCLKLVRVRVSIYKGSDVEDKEEVNRFG